MKALSPIPATAILAVLLTACVTTPLRETRWTAVVCHRTEGAIERIRIGRVLDAEGPPQAVSVDQHGDVVLVRFDGGVPSSRVLYQNGTELTGLALGDVDPFSAGPEVYAGGYRSGKSGEERGGAVFQVLADREPALTRCIWTGDAYVHSIEIVGESPHDRRLLVSTYAGGIHELAPRADGAWSDRMLHAEAPSDDPEANKIKDVGLLVEPSGAPRHVALVAFKTGRLLRLDLERPESVRVVHEEVGGLSRVTPDPAGGAYVTGYQGRLLHVRPNPEGVDVEVLEREGADSGLRGAVLGRFPCGGTTAHLAIFGFHKLCRALVPRLSVLDPVTLYVDADRGHTIEAGDLIPGNGADEILLGGYSRRVTLLHLE